MERCVEQVANDTSKTAEVKSSAVRVITATMQRDTYFMNHKDASLSYAEYSKMLDRGDFEKRLIMGTYFKLEDAYIILAVYTLGHATQAQVNDYLNFYRNKFQAKKVPNYHYVGGDNDLKSRLKHLCFNGLLAAQVFASLGKLVEVYTCTNYGLLYFRNQLDMYSVYDQNSLMRSLYEVCKRLSANSVHLALACNKNCIDSVVNEHLKDQNGTDYGFVYGSVVLQKGNSKMRFVVEPIHFAYDYERMTEEECLKKIEARLDRLTEIVDKASSDMPVVPVFVFENIAGLRKFILLIQRRNLSLYSESLYTSENVCRATKANLSSMFLKVAFDESGAKFACAKSELFSSTI